MKYINVMFTFCLVVVLLLSGCGGGVSYTKKEEVPETNLSDGGNGEKTSDGQEDSTGKNGDVENLDSHQEGFLVPEDRSYDRDALHRTCVVSMGTSDIEKREDMWERIISLPSCERSKKIFWNPNVRLDIPLENINPDFLEFYQKMSPAGYENMKKAGVYDKFIRMYTYEGCDKTIFYQSNNSLETKKRAPEDETDYTGGFITNLVAGDRVNGSITNPLSHEVREFPSELKLDDLRVMPEWFLDEATFNLYISVPYDDYFKLTETSEEEEIPWFVVQSKKGKEEKMRQEIEEILGSSGCVLEGGYYN